MFLIFIFIPLLIILLLIGPITYGCDSFGGPRYRIEDVQSKAEEMAMYLKAIHEGTPGAEDEYRAFKVISQTEKLQHYDVSADIYFPLLILPRRCST